MGVTGTGRARGAIGVLAVALLAVLVALAPIRVGRTLAATTAAHDDHAVAQTHHAGDPWHGKPSRAAASSFADRQGIDVALTTGPTAAVAAAPVAQPPPPPSSADTDTTLTSGRGPPAGQLNS